MNELTALIIGYGSIGRRHAQTLATMVERMAIVDSKESARTQARDKHSTATVVDRLEVLDQSAFPWESAVAIIATWGPSHSEFFHALAARGGGHI